MIYGVDAGSKFLKIVRQGALCPDECAGQDEGTRFIEHNGNPRHDNHNGEALRYSAARDPGRDHIGIEVHAPGVGRLLNALAEDGSDHVRLYHHDAVEVLENEVADASLDEVRIYFPDPWHKKRHNKRRLVNPDFAALLVRKLAPDGRLHLATDWQDYAEQMWDVLDATPGIANRAGPRGQVPRPDWRPQTHFESRGQRLGYGVWDLLYDRTGN